jgi:hypothetical protein
VTKPENVGILRDSTTAEERASCYQITRAHNQALSDCPAWTRDYKDAVAAVERAISELQQLKDRKIGRNRAEQGDCS